MPTEPGSEAVFVYQTKPEITENKTIVFCSLMRQHRLRLDYMSAYTADTRTPLSGPNAASRILSEMVVISREVADNGARSVDSEARDVRREVRVPQSATIWDISKPQTQLRFQYLHVVIDILSRYVVG